MSTRGINSLSLYSRRSIRERKRVQRWMCTIVKSKRQWQFATDMMPQLICLLNEEGHLIQVNRTLERWGLGKVASVRGQHLHDILHPGCNCRDCSLQQLWRNTASARLIGRRTESEVFDPVLARHFSISIQPLPRHDNGVAPTTGDLQTIVIVDDISDLKQSEAYIQLHNDKLAQEVAYEVKRRALSEEMQSRLLTILKTTTDYVAIAGASGGMLYLNPAGRAMLGLGPTDDISQKELCDYCDPTVRDNIHNVAIPAAIENGQWTGESLMRDSTGREIYMSQLIISHRGADGRIECFFTILRDISYRMLAEKALLESQKELRQLSEMLVSIQEDERRRIALDLHDGLGQTLSLIKLALQKSADQVATGANDQALDSLQRTIPLLLKEAMRDVRRVATELHPSILDDLGILPTLSWFFREFEAVCGDQIALEKSVLVSEQEVPVSLKLVLYRVIQEATSNIVKHAAADRVRISLYRDDDELHLLIQDNGRGFDPASVVLQQGQTRGLGLISMRERVACSGGNYHLGSGAGLGTSIRASWPLTTERSESPRQTVSPGRTKAVKSRRRNPSESAYG
jgi:PAS domain S-box-containing protein